MTDTPEQERANPAPDRDRINTEHLRDYTQLRRTTYDRKIAGVAGGLARHLNIDPVIVRVVFVVLIFFGGAGLILYGAAWLLVPEDSGRPATVHTNDSTRNTLLIIAAVVAGLLLVGDSWGGFGFPWPLVIIALIVFGVLMSRDNAPTDAPVSAPAPYPANQPGAAYEAGDQTAPLGQPFQYTGRQYGWQPVNPQPQPVRRKKSGPLLFGLTLALIAAGLGALGLYDAVATDNVADAAYPALALAITGGMLVLGAFYGRPGGLVLLGLISAVALVGTSIAGPRYDGERNLQVSPTSAIGVEDSYSVPAGRIELDLSKVKDLAALDEKHISLDANAGELLVILPPGLSANVTADIDAAGAIELPDDNDKDGFGPSLDRFVGNSNEDPTIELDLELDFGHIEVRQEAA
jgi:phage shock protein PspC (stress-responsive transcriptional regulator)